MRRALVLIALCIVVGYGIFEARKLIEGPEITILSPTDGSATSSPAVLVEGTAQNIAFLTIDDKPAFTDEQGRFKQLLALPPGYTVLTVKATDRFGRRAEKRVTITMLNYCRAHA